MPTPGVGGHYEKINIGIFYFPGYAEYAKQTKGNENHKACWRNIDRRFVRFSKHI